MELIVHEESIKTIIRKTDNKKKARPGAADSDNNDIPMGDIRLVIDNNSMRANAIICEM